MRKELKSINESLWVIEDDIREEERNRQFGERFIELARSVYVTNDQRADVKKRINLHLNSDIVEEKSYKDYSWSMNLLILPGSGSSYNSVRPESEIFVGLARAGHNVTVISKKDNIYTPRFIEHGIRVIEGLTNHKLSLANIKLIKRCLLYTSDAADE